MKLSDLSTKVENLIGLSPNKLLRNDEMQNSLLILEILLFAGSIFTIILVYVQTRRLKEYKAKLGLTQ